MDIQESGEMYLETILLLSQKKSHIRSVDIVEELGYSKSSVSRGVNLLCEKGYIEISADGAITFTDEGKRRAQTVYERHLVLTNFLLEIGVSEDVAEADACRIEHVISDESFEAIKNALKK